MVPSPPRRKYSYHNPIQSKWASGRPRNSFQASLAHFSPFIFIFINRLMRKKILLILPLLLFAITQQLQAVTCNWGYCNSVVNDQFGSVNKGKGAIYIPAEISKM